MRLKGILAVSALALAISFAPAFAGLSGENVAVVVNADSWASLTVANEFIKLRQIPPCNVIYVSGIPNEIQADVYEFRSQVLQPVIKTLTERGLIPQIDCIVYSTDFPCTLSSGRFTTSTNMLTYSYEQALATEKLTGNLGNNFYFRRALTPKVKMFDEAGQAEYRKTWILMGQKKYDELLEPMKKLAEAYPDVLQAQVLYADTALKAGKVEEAVVAWKQAAKCGYSDVFSLEERADLKPLRERADFLQVIAEAKSQTLETEPAHGFRSTTVWPPNSRFAQPSAKGERYTLSCMLGVASGRGNSVTEILNGLRRSVRSDGAAYSGTFYFMLNSDIRSITRRWAFYPVIARLRKMGLSAEVAMGVLPRNKPSIAGLCAGNASLDWNKSPNTVVPGAICEHMTSYGAMMQENAGQTPLSEFLRAGAAGAGGTIVEPTAFQARFPTAFIQVFYASGYSLIESFYLSVEMPDIYLIVGDPLCQPWAKPPKVAVEGLTPDQAVKGAIEFKPVVKDDKTPVAGFEIFVNGRRTSVCKPGESVRLDTAALPDGPAEVRVVAVSADPTETRGREIVPIVISNRSLAPELTCAAKEVRWGQSLEVSAKCAGAGKILILHNAREMAVIEGEQGAAKINSTQLGLGAVTLRACAVMPGAAGAQPQPASSSPLDITVLPPAALPALKAVPNNLVDGILLSAPNQKDALVKTTLPNDWLAKAGGQPGKPFQLHGYVTARTKDVYQFQLRSKAAARIVVDGQEIWNGSAAKWQYLPVSLAEGMHDVVIACDGSDDFDARFGGPGTYHVGVNYFKCSPPQ